MSKVKNKPDEEVIISRDKIKEEHFRAVLDAECHHGHEIVKIGDKYYWKENPAVRKWVDEIGLGKIYTLFECMGIDKNDELLRKLYRDMGYDLFGYWEVFFWDWNNTEASEYVPGLTIKVPSEIIKIVKDIKYGEGSIDGMHCIGETSFKKLSKIKRHNEPILWVLRRMGILWYLEASKTYYFTGFGKQIKDSQ